MFWRPYFNLTGIPMTECAQTFDIPQQDCPDPAGIAGA